MEGDKTRNVQEHTPGEGEAAGNYSAAQEAARAENHRGSHTLAKGSSDS